MAGMEQLEIHSKSYLVRWVKVSDQNTISWSIQPKKRSINFGVFKHPGGGGTPNLSSNPTFDATTPEAEESSDGAASKTRRSSQADSGSAVEKLQKLGMKLVTWVGRCEADQVAMGHYDVNMDGGMYGLVFDNTYSKQLSKTVTFVLMTYPTVAPPNSRHHLHFAQAMARKSSTSVNSPKPSPNLGPVNDSNESLPGPFESPNDHAILKPSISKSGESKPSLGEAFYTGVLSKKRRRRNQGYARRFFSLDFTSCTLSYYKNRNSSALRGAIPLSLVAIATDAKSRHISIDSGAEVWFLKASNSKDFEGWKSALERASQVSTATPVSVSQDPKTKSPFVEDPADSREWARMETLVGTVSGITASVRRLAKDTDPKYLPGDHHSGSGKSSPSAVDGNDYFSNDLKSSEKVSFWRRKSSSHQQARPSLNRNFSGPNLAPPSPLPQGIPSPTKRQDQNYQFTAADKHVHDHCMAILRDLEGVVNDFSLLINEARSRRLPSRRPTIVSRHSAESTRSQEFFDAEEGEKTAQAHGLMKIHNDNDFDERGQGPDGNDDDDAVSIDSTSTVGDEEDLKASQNSKLPTRPPNLYPLPHATISRRKAIPASKGPPPSLISFLRKNVGKDLSTIAMPVTANEPLSLLQRQAEQMEYSHLLDTAASLAQPTDPSSSSSTSAIKRLLYITAFAISSLASSRARERAVRKPFNPMLGETYELCREDLNFRFLAEKISHRPVRIACQAEGGSPTPSGPPTWLFTHAPAPSQKFWGKSAELITEGTARVYLFPNAESYIWDPPHCFLRNIIAGEKYVEPVGTLTVLEQSSGLRAVATFKAGGMFSGRSEDVSVVIYNPDGSQASIGLTGTWINQLQLSSSSEPIWSAGPLTAQPATHYGLTSFATSLNEITALERSALPPTDSRLRPDQRKYEDGGVDDAETLKASLEEAQRRRRREMESRGEEWSPRWFEQVGEGWRAKEGGDSYWSVREAVVEFKGGKWDGVRDVFEM